MASIASGATQVEYRREVCFVCSSETVLMFACSYCARRYMLCQCCQPLHACKFCRHPATPTDFRLDSDLLSDSQHSKAIQSSPAATIMSTLAALSARFCSGAATSIVASKSSQMVAETSHIPAMVEVTSTIVSTTDDIALGGEHTEYYHDGDFKVRWLSRPLSHAYPFTEELVRSCEQHLIQPFVMRSDCKLSQLWRLRERVNKASHLDWYDAMVFILPGEDTAYKYIATDQRSETTLQHMADWAFGSSAESLAHACQDACIPQKLNQRKSLSSEASEASCNVSARGHDSCGRILTERQTQVTNESRLLVGVMSDAGITCEERERRMALRKAAKEQKAFHFEPLKEKASKTLQIRADPELGVGFSGHHSWYGMVIDEVDDDMVPELNVGDCVVTIGEMTLQDLPDCEAAFIEAIRDGMQIQVEPYCEVHGALPLGACFDSKASADDLELFTSDYEVELKLSLDKRHIILSGHHRAVTAAYEKATQLAVAYVVNAQHQCVSVARHAGF